MGKYGREHIKEIFGKFGNNFRQGKEKKGVSRSYLGEWVDAILERSIKTIAGNFATTESSINRVSMV